MKKITYLIIITLVFLGCASNVGNSVAQKDISEQGASENGFLNWELGTVNTFSIENFPEIWNDHASEVVKIYYFYSDEESSYIMLEAKYDDGERTVAWTYSIPNKQLNPPTDIKHLFKPSDLSLLFPRELKSTNQEVAFQSYVKQEFNPGDITYYRHDNGKSGAGGYIGISDTRGILYMDSFQSSITNDKAIFKILFSETVNPISPVSITVKDSQTGESLNGADITFYGFDLGMTNINGELIIPPLYYDGELMIRISHDDYAVKYIVLTDSIASIELEKKTD